MNQIKSGAQGVSGKNVKIGSMLSDHGPQTVTASNSAKIKLMDNRGHKKRKLPFTSIKIGKLTLFKIDFSLLGSFFDSLITFFKK